MQPPIIVPTPLLGHCLGQGLLTNVHVCYASLVRDCQDYGLFYQERTRAGDIVILDHSPELPRMAVDPGLFLRVVNYIRPRGIVLPDRDFDQSRTIQMGESFLERIQHLESFKKLPTIGVLQGTNLKELRECYQWMKDKVTAIGLHSGLENILPRNQLVGELRIRYPAVLIEVHKDLMEETPKSPVIDLGWTSMPARLAYQGRKLSSIHPTPPGLNFQDEYEPLLLRQNLRRYIERFTLKAGSQNGNGNRNGSVRDVRRPLQV